MLSLENLAATLSVEAFPPVTTFLKCVRETVKCGRLYNSFVRWFSERRKKRDSILL